MTHNLTLKLKKESALEGVWSFFISIVTSLVLSCLVCIGLYFFSDFTNSTILKSGIGIYIVVQAIGTNKSVFKLIGQQFSNDALFKNTPAMIVCVLLNVATVSLGTVVLFDLMQNDNQFLKVLIGYLIIGSLALGANDGLYMFIGNKKEDVFCNLSVNYGAAVSIKAKPFLVSYICYIVLVFVVGLSLMACVL